MRTRFLVTTLVIVCATGLATAGSLEPSGPPAPTGKSLHVVEPRTPIHTLGGSGTAVYAITEPGSYYFAHNIYGVNAKNGIEITADNVTVDLMGFSLIGVTGSLDGIKDAGDSSHTGLVVRNGFIHDWDENGINFHSSVDVLVEGVIIKDCEGWGYLGQGGIAIVKDSQFIRNLIGVDIAGGEIIRCVSRGNEGSGAQISGGTEGVVREFVAVGNQNGLVQAAGGGWLFENNTFSSNSMGGISVCWGNTIRNNTVADNGSDTQSVGSGIEVRCGGNLVDSNLVADNDIGISAFSAGGEVVIRNILYNNTTDVDASTGNDFAPIQKAATSTNPWANISN